MIAMVIMNRNSVGMVQANVGFRKEKTDVKGWLINLMVMKRCYL